MDPYELALADEGTVAQKAAAMVAALRRDQTLGQVLQLTGHRAVAPLGASIAKGAQDQVEQMPGILERRPGMALQRAQLGKLQEQDAVQKDPATAKYLRKAIGMFAPGMAGPELDAAPASVLQQTLGTAEKYGQAQASAQARKEAAQAAAQDRASRAEAAKEAKDAGDTDKQFVALGNALNLARGRQGEAGKAMGTLQQAARDAALIAQNPNPPPQQLYELARGLDRLISGAAPTIGATEHLIPKTWRGSLADFSQWLTSQPKGAGGQAFVKQMQETINRIRESTQGFVDSTNAKTVNAYSHLSRKNAERFKSAIRSAELDPSNFDQTTWEYRGAPKAQPVEAHPQDSEAVQWAKANPGDPRAVAILKANGVQ